MIRFVDMRAADIAGSRFAFWNTTTDSFVPLIGYAWDTWAEFEEEYQEEHTVRFSNNYPLERFKALCPPWAFEPVPEEGVCFRCLREGHEPEECPRDAATVIQAVCLALRETAAHREQHGDIVEPRTLRNFADSIDPTSEEYDPKQDPLVSQ